MNEDRLRNCVRTRQGQKRRLAQRRALSKTPPATGDRPSPPLLLLRERKIEECPGVEVSPQNATGFTNEWLLDTDPHWRRSDERYKISLPPLWTIPPARVQHRQKKEHNLQNIFSCQSTPKPMTQSSEDHPGVDEVMRQGEHHHVDVMDEESTWPPNLESGNQWGNVDRGSDQWRCSTYTAGPAWMVAYRLTLHLINTCSQRKKKCSFSSGTSPSSRAERLAWRLDSEISKKDSREKTTIEMVLLCISSPSFSHASSLRPRSGEEDERFCPQRVSFVTVVYSLPFRRRPRVRASASAAGSRGLRRRRCRTRVRASASPTGSSGLGRRRCRRRVRASASSAGSRGLRRARHG